MNTGKTQFKKGHTPWHKGKTGVYSEDTLKRWSEQRKDRKNPHTEEWNKKISDKNKGQGMGRIVSEDVRKKISLSLKGHKVSDETRKKIGSSQKGDKGNNWQGGITLKGNNIRRSLEYITWAKEVLSRDKYTDQKYGVTNDLVVHHIKNFSQYPELRFSVSNGVTLSKKSHAEFHKVYGRKNNNQEQLDDFLGFSRTVINCN